MPWIEKHLSFRFSTLSFVGLILAIVVIFAVFIKYHERQPDPRYVNGVYVNKCCSDVIIRDGKIWYNSESAHIRLVLDKFGLHGYIDQPIGPFSKMDRGEMTPSVLVFEDHHQFSTIDSAGKERIFVRLR